MKRFFYILGTFSRSCCRVVGHPYFIAGLLVVFFFLLLFKFRVDVNDPLFIVSALTAGWIIAFRTTYWTQKKKYIDELRFSAAKTLITLASETASALVSLDSDIRGLNSRFNLRKSSSGEFFGEWGDVREKTHADYEKYEQAHLTLLRHFEENEMFFLNFRQRINVFSIHQTRISEAYYHFSSTLQVLILMHLNIPKEDEHTKKIRDEMEVLSSTALDEIGLYMDLRVDLLNDTLGHIMHKRVAHRIPADPRVKLLSEVAKTKKHAD